MAYRSFGRVAVLCASMSSLAACASGTQEPSVADIRSIAERYRDVAVAKAEGYTTDNKCVTAEMLGFSAAMGTMGLHYVRRVMLGLPPKPAPAGGPRVSGTGAHTDFRKPAMLVYEPQEDGSLELVAVENLVFRKAWEDAGNKGLPTFHGVEYDHMFDDPETSIDEAHMFEPHYDRHVWLYRPNANGMFAQFNPTVTCRFHKPVRVAKAGTDHAGH